MQCGNTKYISVGVENFQPLQNTINSRIAIIQENKYYLIPNITDVFPATSIFPFP